MRSLGGYRAGEVRLGRFLRNAKVSAAEIMASAASGTASRVSGLHILAIQDTTSLRNDGDQLGMVAHPTIAVDAESGSLLGLVHGQILRREGGKRARRKKRPFAEKDSHRWLDGAEAAAGLIMAGAAQVTVVADRECDIYEFFAHKPQEVELLVRATHDRVLDGNGDNGGVDGKKISDRLSSMAAQGWIEVAIPASRGRAGRSATLELRFCTLDIKRPHNIPASTGLVPSIRLNMVEAREIDAPEKTIPICWRLLTTHRIETLEQAQWIIGLYRKRWIVEELFRTLKSKGFRIEQVSIADAPFEILAAAALVAAISVMQMVRDRDGDAKRPLEDVFNADEFLALEAVSKSLEGKTQKQKNPHPKDSLAFAAWVCGRLGGWTGYYGKAGPIVILRGLYEFKTMQRGWRIAKDV